MMWFAGERVGPVVAVGRLDQPFSHQESTILEIVFDIYIYIYMYVYIYTYIYV